MNVTLTVTLVSLSLFTAHASRLPLPREGPLSVFGGEAAPEGADGAAGGRDCGCHQEHGE